MQLGSFLSPKLSEFGSTAPPFIAGGGGKERWNTLFATKRERKCYLHFIPNRKGLNFTKLCCLGAVYKWRHHFRRVSTVFTSDYPCIESMQYTLHTWVVWSENREYLPKMMTSFMNTNSPILVLLFLLDPFHRRGRVYKRKFCVSVCLSVRNHFFLLRIFNNLII